MDRSTILRRGLWLSSVGRLQYRGKEDGVIAQTRKKQHLNITAQPRWDNLGQRVRTTTYHNSPRHTATPLLLPSAHSAPHRLPLASASQTSCMLHPPYKGTRTAQCTGTEHARKFTSMGNRVGGSATLTLTLTLTPRTEKNSEQTYWIKYGKREKKPA